MPRNRRITGKFWPAVRALIWETAYELHIADFHAQHEGNPTWPTRAELREDGYFYEAKLRVLRDINRIKRGYIIDPEKPPTLEEWEATREAVIT